MLETTEQEIEVFRDGQETELCRLLAAKVRDDRLAAKESQIRFSKRAGIPFRTYRRFEKDGSGTLETFIRALRALGHTQCLLQLFPPSLPPPPLLEAEVGGRHRLPKEEDSAD